MKTIIAISLLLVVFAGCTKNKCYIVLNSANEELCAKCFHTTDERDAWVQAYGTKTPEEQCR